MDKYKRKERSDNKLCQLGMERNPLLPPLKDSSEVAGSVKSPDEAIMRFLCSYLASVISFIKISMQECPEETHFSEEDLEGAYRCAEKFGIRGYATEGEGQVLDGNGIGNPLRIEGAYILSWALGISPALHLPDRPCDMFFLDAFLNSAGSIGNIKNAAKIRDLEEVLDELDFEYRCSMAAYRPAYGSKYIPKSPVIPDVVWERRIALEWYIGNHVSWDKGEVNG